MFKNILTLRLAMSLAVTYLAVLAFGYGREQGWLVNAGGHAQAVEYVGIRAAGELARQGQPASAYDWDKHARQQRSLTAQSNDDYYPFPYPPPVLALASALAALPYVASALIWIAATLLFSLITVARLSGTSHAAAWTLAAPTTFINAYVLHTGFLTAGLFGAGLLWLTAAPIASGIAFGLLAVKPQLALMIPVALVAGRHWRTIAAAAITCAALGVASVGIYGTETWTAFFAQLDRVTDIFRSDATNMAMLASLYGLSRILGLSHTASLLPQALITLTMAVAVFQLWRSDADQNLKAAGLVIASLVAAPYLYIYDLTALPLAALLLWRHTRNLDDVELGSVLCAGTLAALFQVSPLPLGFFATVVIGALVVRRWRSASKATAQLPARQLVSG